MILQWRAIKLADLRFSLRSLIVVMTLLCLVAAGAGYRYRAVQKTTASWREEYQLTRDDATKDLLKRVEEAKRARKTQPSPVATPESTKNP